MDVVIFNGTPRIKGNTAELTKNIAGKMKDKNADVREIFLNPLNIKGCQNCGMCQKVEGKCSIDDDMTPLYEAFKSADIVILASPIYMWYFTAPMKAFMDRLHALCNDDHSYNAMEGKKIAIAMTMGDDEFVAASAVNSVMFFCEYFKCIYSGTIAVPFASKEQIARPLYQEKINDFVESLGLQ